MKVSSLALGIIAIIAGIIVLIWPFILQWVIGIFLIVWGVLTIVGKK